MGVGHKRYHYGEKGSLKQYTVEGEGGALLGLGLLMVPVPVQAERGSGGVEGGWHPFPHKVL